MAQLEPCPKCRRHVRTSETVCPFCSSDIASSMQRAPARPLPTTRLGRAALFAFGLSVAATSALEGCSDSDDDSADDDTSSGDDSASEGSKDGGGSKGDAGGSSSDNQDAGGRRDAGTSLDAGSGGSHDAGGGDAGHAGASDAGAPDGGKPDGGKPDAGASDGGRARDSGGVIALYGLPPAPPTVMPLYGAPTQGESS